MPKMRFKVNSYGHIIIPDEIREKYGIKKDDYVSVELRGEGILILNHGSIETALEWLRQLRREKQFSRWGREVNDPIDDVERVLEEIFNSKRWYYSWDIID